MTLPDQKAVWEREHQEGKTFPQIQTDQPSSAVIDFIHFLQQEQRNPRTMDVLDLGCGMGRNAIHLACHGFDVDCIDFSSTALQEVKKRYKATEEATGLRLIEGDLTGDFFCRSVYEAIIDCYTTICIPEPARHNLRRRLYGMVNPGGFYLFCGIGITDFVVSSPGPEPNSTMFPSGKFEKQYDHVSLLSEFDGYILRRYKQDLKTEFIDGRTTTFPVITATFQKPFKS